MTTLLTAKKMIELTVDGQAVRVFEGSTILDACRQLGDRDADALLRRHADAGERLPRLRRRARGRADARAGVLAQGGGGDGRAHRLGARAHVAAARARAARLVGRPLDRARSARVHRAVRREAGPLRPRRGARRARGEDRQRPLRARLLEVHPLLQCVEACGVDHQNTFAIAVAGRGFDAHISTELDVTLPESACVYCGNCIAVCPTGALMSKREYDMRQDGTWDESQQEVVTTVCALLRRRLQPGAARAGRRDRQRHVAGRPRRDARQPLHQGPLRLPVRRDALTVTSLHATAWRVFTRASLAHARGYNFISGPLADITLLTAFLGTLYLWLRKHNCHVRRCWHLEWPPHPDHGHPVCRKHHPDGKGLPG